MTNTHHGITVKETSTGTRLLATAAASIIALVATADDASAETFPLDTPILLSDVAAAQADAGTTGTLSRALQDIAGITNPLTVVVRVAEGADDAERDTNIIGTDAGGVKTGLQALLAAETIVGVKPTILAVPGAETIAVVGEMSATAVKLGAQAYAEIPAATKEDAVTFRGNFSSRNLMLFWPGLVDQHVGAVAAAQRAYIDATDGFQKTLSNVAVTGVTGTDTPISFDILSPATDAGYLNDNDITTIIRRDGFRFWGNRTVSDDPLFAFESAARTAEIIKKTVADGHVWAIDKPISATLIKDIVAGINSAFRTMVQAGELLGGKAWLNENANLATQLAGGALTIDYDYTPVVPAESLTFNQRITDSYTFTLLN